MRGFNSLLTGGEGLHSSGDESGRQERSLDGIGRFAGQEHSLGLGHEAGGISHVRGRRQIKQRGERVRFTFEARGKVEVADQSVHQQHRGFQTVRVFEPVSDRLLHELANLVVRGIAMAISRRLREGLTPRKTGLEQFWVPSASGPGAGVHRPPDSIAAHGLESDDSSFAATPPFRHTLNHFQRV